MRDSDAGLEKNANHFSPRKNEKKFEMNKAMPSNLDGSMKQEEIL